MIGNKALARFLLLYACAYAGSVVAYAPLLTLLLPTEMAAMAGAARVQWLAAATFLGGLSAGLSNIAFGWASDRWGGRRPWVMAGLLGTIASYGLIGLARSPMSMVAAIMVYQVALNMMIGPLTAWAADTVPDNRKGMLGGLLSIAPPAGAASGVIVTLPPFEGFGIQLAIVCLIFGALIAPLLLFGGRQPVLPNEQTAGASHPRPSGLLLLSASRLLVSIAGSVLFAFLLYYFQSLPGRDMSPASLSRLIGLTLIGSAVLALMVGRASDRRRRRRPGLIASAWLGCAGLVVMAAATSTLVAVVGYVLFGCSLGIFLALQQTFAMERLPDPHTRGRDLGLFNLTNTIPAMISPILTLTIVPHFGFATLMGTLAVMVAIAGLLVAAVRENDTHA